MSNSLKINVREQIANTRREGRTSRSIRSLVLASVDAALRHEFGPNYSIRCLQASTAIQAVLDSVGIKSQIHVGSVCLSRVSQGSPLTMGWAGFWGAAHHTWVITEFQELVDLAISQLHLHPESSEASNEPIPAFWYSTRERWPPIVFYLPDGPCKVQLSTDEQQELDRIVNDALKRKDEFLKRGLNPFENVIHGPAHLEQLTQSGNPWLVKSLEFKKREIPLPDWIEKRVRASREQSTRTDPPDTADVRKERMMRRKMLKNRKKKRP